MNFDNVKNDNKRNGDYTIILKEDVKCWFCGDKINRGEKAIKIYEKGNCDTYYHTYNCTDTEILCDRCENYSSVKNVECEHCS